MSLMLDPSLVEPFVAGLVGGIDVETGPTEEQLRVLGAIVSHVWNRPDIDLGSVATLEPDQMVHAEMDRHQRRLRCEQRAHLQLEHDRRPESEHRQAAHRHHPG